MNGNLDTRERLTYLNTGRWGDSSAIMQASSRWYEALGIPVDLVREGRLHPYAEFLANEVSAGEQLSLPQQELLEAPPSVDASPTNPATWAFSQTSPDEALLRELTARTESTGWNVEPPSAETESMLASAVDLLETLGNGLTDPLKFTRRHLVVRSDRLVGRTWVDVGGVIVSGIPGAFESIETLAESIYHESLHAKFYAVERQLNEPTPDLADDQLVVRVPWQQDLDGKPQRWNAHRALDAYYVYVHLGVLRSLLLSRSRSERDLDRLRRVCFRAAYLNRQIEATCLNIIDAERLAIWRWLDGGRVREFDLSVEGRALLEDARVAA